MIDKIFDNLPRVFVVGALLMIGVSYVLAGSQYEGVTRLILYVPYAIATVVLTSGYIFLIRRSQDGKVAVWLVAATYATAAFAVTMWGIVGLVSLTWFVPDMEGGETFRKISYALVGGGMSGDVIAATVLVIGFRTHTLNKRIWPWLRRPKT